jgi:hypothetical protein
MQRKGKNLVAILALGMLATGASGGPSGYRPLAALVKEADAIVVGRATNVTPVPGGLFGTIEILRVLKGMPTEGEQLQARWTSSSISASAPSPTEGVGVWFLKWGNNGQWQIMSPVVGGVPFSMTYLAVAARPPSGVLSIRSDMDPLEKLICEIAATLQSTGGKSQIAMFLATSGALDDVTSAVARKAWAEVAASADPHVRLLGLQALIRAGDTSAIVGLRSDASVLNEIAKQPLVAASLCDFRNPQDAAVLALGDLTKAGLPAQVKRCAAYSLRAMHTPNTLPILATLLDADAVDLRYEGVLGLASFANALPMQTRTNLASMEFTQPTSKGPFATEDTLQHSPTEPAFRQDEMKYVGFWKAWWAIHQSQLAR